MTSSHTTAIDPAIFERLQANIDEDAEVRDQLKNILSELEKQGRNAQAILARAHSVPTSNLKPINEQAATSVQQQAQKIRELAAVASKYPYYKYNQLWNRDLQNTIFEILLCGYLGGKCSSEAPAIPGQLLKIEDVGNILGIPVNIKDRDAFHLSIEDYLHGLISLIDELARLAINSVTLGDYERPLQISQFIKDVHAGFQLLNLKNDALRRRSDSIKYSVKKVEDVVYDLSLRNLIPKAS